MIAHILSHINHPSYTVAYTENDKYVISQVSIQYAGWINYGVVILY